MADDGWEVMASRQVAGGPEVTTDQWQRAVAILVEKPQSVDRRLSGQLSLGQATLPLSPVADWLQLADRPLSPVSHWLQLADRPLSPVSHWLQLADRLSHLDPTAAWETVQECVTRQHHSSKPQELQQENNCDIAVQQREEHCHNTSVTTDLESNSSNGLLCILQKMVHKNVGRHPDYVRLVVMGESFSLFLTVGSSEPQPYRLQLR
jgi:hypothetical protein